MLYMLIQIISAIALATLLAIPPSYAQQYRQPTQQEIAGARTQGTNDGHSSFAFKRQLEPDLSGIF